MTVSGKKKLSNWILNKELKDRANLISSALLGKTLAVFSLLILVLSLSGSAIAQSTSWDWMNGSNALTGIYSPGTWGTKGTPAAANTPSSRYGAQIWITSNGRIWLFGGYGPDINGVISYMNDLWWFNTGTNQWVYVQGDPTNENGLTNGGNNGVYLSEGMPNPSSYPGGRANAITWVDKNGNLWMFGGDGIDGSSTTASHLGDLWLFNPTTSGWEWVSGPNSGDQAGVYGTKGTPDVNNNPGARDSASVWQDSVGDIWMFGGWGIDSTGTLGAMNDLWVFDPVAYKWTWMAGSKTTVNLSGNKGVYGSLHTPSTSNVPGSRYGAMVWTDMTTNTVIWVWGGNGYDSAGTNGDLNDLWSYNAIDQTWTWQGGLSALTGGAGTGELGSYGSRGVTAATNIPGGRYSFMTAPDNAGNIWLYGGLGADQNGTVGYLNDLWSVNIATSQWTWLSGSTTVPSADGCTAPIYGTEWTGSTSNQPGGRQASAAAMDSHGQFWLFGGRGCDKGDWYGTMNDLWMGQLPSVAPQISPASGNFSGTQAVTITDADPLASIYYTTDGTTPTASSTPYSGAFNVTKTTTVNAVALSSYHGLSGVSSATYTALVVQVATPDITPATGTYSSTQNVTITDSTPGSTIYYTTDGSTPTVSSSIYTAGFNVSVSTTVQAFATASGDTNSNVAIDPITIATLPANLGWTWKRGPNTVNAPGVAGSLGVANPAYDPGSRADASSATDANGNVWLFGGDGFDVNSLYGILNDLWMYNPTTNEWAWEGGLNTVPAKATGNAGNYGPIGVAGTDFYPGGRDTALMWFDASGNLWIFGGLGYDSAGHYGNLNDLWEFTPSNGKWTWVEGSNTRYASSVIGTPGVPSTSNIPGALYGGSLWIDANGLVWISTGNETGSNMMEMWNFNSVTLEWTYVSGLSPSSYKGIYGSSGVPSAANWPGSRDYARSWVDSFGNFWLFGGFGYDSAGNIDYLNDWWKYDPILGQWAWMGGVSTMPGGFGVAGVYGSLGTADPANAPGGRDSSYTWTDKAGNLWLYGGLGYDQGRYFGNMDDLWLFDPVANEWTWMGGSKDNDVAAVYGSLGVWDSANTPGGRSQSISFVDASGNFGLFGGACINWSCNDLWLLSNTPPTPVAATPTFNPPAGTYTGTQNVTISSTTSGATIYYTTDGSTPTTSSTQYTAPVSVSSSETLNAIATATGYTNSNVGSAAYTINTPQAAIPTFNPPAGTYASAQSVTISDTTPGASIYYTTDGSTPTTSSAKYSTPVNVAVSETLKAIATATGYTNSNVGTAAYTINIPQAATPTFNPPAGTYSAPQNVTITDTTSGASIYYTTDGSAPTTSSTLYSAPVAVNASETLKAIATATGYTNSNVGTAAYTINIPQAATPTFNPPAGTYAAAQQVTISDSTSGASIYFTTDGSTPTTSSTLYSAPVTVSASETLKAIATATGYTTSNIGTAAYTINIPQAATPTFTPAAGTYSSSQQVTINDTTSGATIYYTTDGSTPSTSSTQYTGAITVGGTETLKAIATASGYTNSSVGTAAYVISSGVDFALSATPASITAFPGDSLTYNISVLSVNGTFNNAVALSASGLPAGATLSFSPATVTPGNAGATSVMKIQLPSGVAMNRGNQSVPDMNSVARAITPVLAVLLLLPFRRVRKASRKLMLVLLILVSLGAVFGLSGCGSTASGYFGQQPQNYTITVTGTSGALTNTTTVSLTVE
jgi:N-acetylneuraminic acid mutarotase